MSDDANALLEAVLDGNPSEPSDAAESSPAKEVVTEDTANDSKVETIETKEEATEEEVPFHKHPKFQRLFNENKEYVEKNRVLEDRLQRFEETLNQVKNSGKQEEIPEEFAELVGSNPKAYKLLEKFVQKESEKIIAQAEQRRQQESQAVTQAEKRIIAEFDAIADEDDGFTDSKRNEVLGLMNEASKNDSWLAPKQAYKLWKQMNESKITQPSASKEAKRQAASKTTSSNRADEDSTGITSEDIAKTDKQSLIRKFLSLKQ